VHKTIDRSSGRLGKVSVAGFFGIKTRLFKSAISFGKHLCDQGLHDVGSILFLFGVKNRIKIKPHWKKSYLTGTSVLIISRLISP